MTIDCNKTMCCDIACISCYPNNEYGTEDEDERATVEEIAAFVAIPPENLVYDRDDVLAESTALAQECVASIPEYATPAQSRIGVRNMIKVYEKTSQILQAMLAGKTGELH